MASTVDICNLALLKVGAARITSLLDNTPQAKELNAIYAMKRDSELSLHPWTFAIKRAKIPAESTAPITQWARKFPLPADYLRLVQVGEVDAFYDSGYFGALFDVEAGCVVSNEASPLSIRYVSRITEPGLFHALFVESFACALAMEVCEARSQNLAKRDDIQAQYERAIRAAKRANVIERPPQRMPEGSWVRAMLGEAE